MAKLDRKLAFDLASDKELLDYPKEFAAGANTMLSSALGSLDKSKLGDIARLLKGKPTKSDVEFARLYQKDKAEQLAKEYLDAGTIFQDGQEVLNEGSQYWLDKRSPKAKRVDEYIEQGAGFTDTIGRYAENPSAIVGHTVRNLPQLMPLLVLKNAPVSAQMNLGNVYQGEVGGQQAREQSLQDSKDQNALDRFNSANEAQGLGSAISQAAGTIGLRGDTAMLNLLTGQGTKGLTTKSIKEAGKHLGLNVAEETIDEGGSPFATNIAAKQNYDKGRDVFKDVGKQAAAGAVIGAGMGSVQAGSLAVFGDNQNTNNQNNLAQAIISTIPKQDIPKQYQNAFNAFEDAKQAEAQAQAAYEANPTPESEDALAQATDARLKANNQFSQYDAAFKQTFTEQEQQDLLANDLKGIAARAKLAEEAKQAELNSKAEQEALAKAQRANMVKGLAAYADNEEVLLNEVNQLGLDDTQKELLLREVFAEHKNAKAKPQQTQTKTPLELAVDEHFDTKGNRKPSVMSSDVADKHKVSLNELLPAIAKRNNDIKIQKAQAEKQAKVDAFNKSQAQQKTKDVQREQLAEQQQLENTLADFAAENDTDSMLSMLEGYDKTEADKLFNNAFKTVETRTKEAEKATKAKEAEAAKQEQAKQKQAAFKADMAALYTSNPNATYSDWKAVGKKYGVTSAIDLANAWATAKSNKPKLALPAPNNVMVTDAQGNTTKTTENNVPKKQRNADVSVPSGLKVDVSNAANTQRDRGIGSYSGSASNLIVRQDGKPFPTEQVAQQALTNKATKKTKTKNNEPTISKETHTVVPVDGGYAIAPVEQVEPIAQQEAKAEPKQEAAPEQTDDITGEYTHSQFPDAQATVSKTAKGYDINWGDEVESFTGKNAVEKTKAALKKENFNKKNPDDDNGGVAVEPVAPKPKPVSPSGGVIPRVHLDGISGKLKDGKTVEEIATRIQKRLPHLTIEDVTQQVLAEQAKASKPATLDSVIGKYSDDEEVDAEIRQSGEVLKQFLPETVDDWKIDNDTFATRDAWRVSYTKPFIQINRITGKEVVSSTTTAAPLDIDILLSGDEQAIKNHIKERLTKNGITPKGVKDWRLDDTVSPTGQQVVDNTPTKPVSPMGGNSAPQAKPKTDAEQIRTIGSKEDGLIASKFREDLKSFLTKIDEIDGYENEPSDLHKFSTFLTNEILQKRAENQDDLKGFISKSLDLALDGSNYIGLEGVFNDRSRINAVEEFLYKKAKSTESLSFENKEKDYSKSTGQQISEAMDKTAQAITEAAHNKVVERVKNGEEIVYKQSAAIERAKQDERYQVEINDKGHAVVKNIKDLNGEWVKKDEPVTAESSHIENGKIEEVTGEVIRESLAKVDDKPINGRTMSLKEAKQWLLDSIDKAIAVAPKTLNKAGKDAIEIVNTFSRVEESKTQKEELEKARKILEPLYITFDVPNDGKFKVLNTIESLQRFKANIEKTKGFTENQKPVKPFSAPSENSPETTIMGFLNDGELENAYFFAENQKKPIRFTLSNKKEPIAYFLTEPVDLGNNITGFVGISTDPMSKSKRWLVIEEKSRTSIGFEEISKQAAIKSAKARLSSLRKEDLEGLAAKITPINKTDEEMKADWLAKNNIKIDDEKTGIIKEEYPKQETNSKTPTLDKHNALMDSSLPVNTGVNARMVIIDKQESSNQDTDNKPKFSRSNRVSDIDNLYLDAIKRGDIEEAQRLVIEAAEKAGVPIINDESATAYKVRRSATPIRTQKAYKLFRVKKSQKGEVFALFVGNKDPLPQGVWLDAIPGEAALNPKTGEPTKVKSSLGALAYRPGWHAGDIPLATHIGAMDKEGNIFARKDDEVWAEVEMIADIDYQPEANENGIRNGKFSPAYADIKRMPVDGLYRYKTNANMTGNWIISSSMKINKILTEDEVNSILIANNAKTMPWAKEVKTKDKTEKTDARSQKVWEKTNLDLAKWGLTDNPAKNQQKLLDPITYDDNGNIIPLSERFNIESDDPRYSSQSSTIGDRTVTQVREKLVKHFGEKIISLLEKKGILKIHQSMSDKDIPAEALRSIKAYHGSPAMFDKFMREFVNSGEGAQAFGWGHYFAGRKALAEWYRTVLSNDFNRTSLVFRKDGERVRLTDLHEPKYEWEKVNEDELVELFKKYLLGKQGERGKTWQADTDPRYDALAEIAKDLSRYNKDTPSYTELKAVQQVMQKYKSKQFSAQRVSTAHNKTGQLYEVDIAAKEESFLDWFTKFDDLSPTEQKSLAKVFKEFDAYGDLDTTDKTIGQLYQKVTRYSRDGTPKRLSLALQDLGYSGIKFLDQESRKNPYEKQYFNYVVFDENIISIKDTYYSKQQGVTEGFYFNGTIHLIADNLTDETIIPTFVHELGGHKGFQEMMSPKAYELIMQQFNRLVAQGNAIAIKAKQRAEKAEKDTARQQDEYIPYLLTEQEKAQLATPQQRNAVQRLIDHIVRAVKGWVVRHLSKYDTTYKMSRRVSESLTPADIFYMAERMVGEIAKRGGDNNNSPKFSKTEQSQFDQLLAKADKMIAEQGKLLAPNGKPSKLNRYQWAQVRTDNFKAWFGNWENDPENSSKAVDENGEPKVVYHGSGQEFYIFDKKKATDSEGRKYGVGTGKGVFSFTENNDIASNWANRAKNRAEYGVKSDMPTVISAFLNIKRPITRNEFESMLDEKFIGYDFRLPKIRDKFISEIYTELKKKKIDGIMSDFGEITAFYPTQIKSAIGNNGEFSPTNPDIRFSRAEDKAKAAKDYVLDSVRIKRQVAENLHAKAELGWWSKTIGTQLNTAKKFKDFDRVYKLLQRLLQHQSSDVMDALEVAPTLLEKLDSLSDLKEQGKSIGRNIAQYARKVRTGEMTDREAVAKVIFSETLAKKPLSQAELEQKLTPQQLKLYEEAREAINVSLKNTAKSEIIRSLLQNDVINFDTVEKLLNQQTGFDEFIDEMLENVGARISNAQEELSQAETDVEKQAIKDELKRLADMYNSISDVNAKVYQLIDEAYAPLMRFGDYALTMRDKTTGKVLSFMMFESKAERNRMVNYLGTEYGDTVTLETDTMSTEEFKQFKGITPESLALFAKEIGLSQDEATQAYLKLAIPATSALTRRIHRKGTEGYNEDIQRVLASFVMSNARYSAKNIYLAKVNEAINDIESGKSIKDQALKMRDNTINPADTSAWLRDLLFVWNLGGSVMFAFLNMTQPFMQALPMLSQYVNTGFATKHILRGIKVAGAAMVTGNAPKGYKAEYKRAVQEGIVDPQNTFMLTGLERGGTGTTSKTWTGTKHILGIFAQMSESLNRKAVFIASLEVANAKGGAWLKQKGYASAYDFAVDVISQTQGVYNKANRSNWAHSQLGAPLLVFKQFSINYVEQMIRMWKNQNEGEEGKKAVLLAMMMLFSLAGGMGLPFIKDIFDGSETIAAFMGNPVNIEREMRLMGKQYLGETTTGALMDGWLNKLVIGEVLGADVQSRTGMGDLIPATNFFNKTIYGTDQQVSEGMSIFGTAGGLGDKVGDSLNFMANDEFGDAFVTIMPRFATSLYRGYEMMTTGETTDSKGRRLFDTTFGEGLVKFLDSQPVRMAELSRARGLEYDDIAIQSSKIDYYKKKWIKAAQKEDDEAIEQIEQDIEDWNENNEKYPVIFDRQRAYQSANKNEMTWGEREERTKEGMEWLNEERPDWLNE